MVLDCEGRECPLAECRKRQQTQIENILSNYDAIENDAKE